MKSLCRKCSIEILNYSGHLGCPVCIRNATIAEKNEKIERLEQALKIIDRSAENLIKEALKAPDRDVSAANAGKVIGAVLLALQEIARDALKEEPKK